MTGKEAIIHYLGTHNSFCAPDVAALTGATVTSINQAAAKMARAGLLVIEGKVWRTVYYRFATREEREGKMSTNLIFKECRQSAAMKRVSHGAIWNNPPYSNIRPWVEKAAEQCIQQRQTVVMLVPEDMSVGWFSKALESVDEVRIITDGRINFIEPSTGLEKKGNSKGSMLLIWRPFISPRRMFTTVSKAALMAIGQGVRRYE
ncbi:TPA: phage N-6-adenine-methyltransferase [Escherichia coli]|nr:phage N-6-adenine-methyltransferase [Escherichia coli]